MPLIQNLRRYSAAIIWRAIAAIIAAIVIGFSGWGIAELLNSDPRTLTLISGLSLPVFVSVFMVLGLTSASRMLRVRWAPARRELAALDAHMFHSFNTGIATRAPSPSSGSSSSFGGGGGAW